jgi:hypothetical protein
LINLKMKEKNKKSTKKIAAKKFKDSLKWWKFH